MKISKNKLYMFSLIAVVVLVLLDQYTKYLAVSFLKGTHGIVLIDGVLQLLYVENRGAAFGVLQNGIIFFCIVTAVILIAIIYAFKRMPLDKKYMPLFILLTFLSAGAVGNLIDRIANRFVVDFIYFSLIDFPVFNVADIYVTVSTALIIILSLFKYRDDDFAFLRFKKDIAFHEQKLIEKVTNQNQTEEDAAQNISSEEIEKSQSNSVADAEKAAEDQSDTDKDTKTVDESVNKSTKE